MKPQRLICQPARWISMCALAVRVAKVSWSIAVAAVLSSTAPSMGGYMETWNEASAGANGWVYWSKSDTEPLVPWLGAGGQDGGYVSIDLSILGAWPSVASLDYYPAYTFRDATRSIDIAVEPMLKVSLKDESGASAPLNLAGGHLYFWMGRNDGVGSTYYSFNTPLDIGDGDWIVNELALTSHSADWGLIYDDQGKTLADLLAEPQQQWGFRIFDGTGDPQGQLGFDNFSIGPVPEPAPLMLLGWTGLALLQRRRLGQPNRA